MAWVVDSNIVNSDGVVTTLAVPVPTGHQSGDLLVATVTQNTGTGTLSISGWTAIGSQAAENTQHDRQQELLEVLRMPLELCRRRYSGMTELGRIDVRM